MVASSSHGCNKFEIALLIFNVASASIVAIIFIYALIKFYRKKQVKTRKLSITHEVLGSPQIQKVTQVDKDSDCLKELKNPVTSVNYENLPMNKTISGNNPKVFHEVPRSQRSVVCKVEEPVYEEPKNFCENEKFDESQYVKMHNFQTQ